MLLFFIFLIGLGLGFLLAFFLHSRNSQEKALQKALSEANLKLHEQAQDMTVYFNRTSQLVNELGNSYIKLYSHMAEATQSLLSESERKHLFDITSLDQQFTLPKGNAPKDYADGVVAFYDEKSSASNQELNKGHQTLIPKDYADGASGLFHEQILDEKPSDKQVDFVNPYEFKNVTDKNKKT